MRLTNCKIVCNEIEEADHGQRLSPSATEHLGGCPQCQTFHDERSKLRQLVASLETVAAPPDFDFRVRSRLANERSNSRAGLLFSNLTFGIPSLALAALALVIGGVFALRVWNAPTANRTAVQTETPEASKPNRAGGQPPSTESGLRSNGNEPVLAAAKNDSRETSRQDRQIKKRSPLGSAVASSRNRRLATREFSSTPAPVVKQEETVASVEAFPIFLIEASSQPLRLSLDYSGGVSRTISVPALSFGSERVLAGDGLSLVKNSPKGAW